MLEAHGRRETNQKNKGPEGKQNKPMNTKRCVECMGITLKRNTISLTSVSERCSRVLVPSKSLKIEFSPMKPLPPLHREPREQRSPATLEALAPLDVPNPGEAARENLPPCHSVKIKLEAHEFEESRHESKQEHQKKFR